MRKTAQKYIVSLLTVVLIWSMIAPSFVFANEEEQNSFTIQSELLSESGGFELNRVSGYALNENGQRSDIYFSNDYVTNEISYSPTYLGDPDFSQIVLEIKLSGYTDEMEQRYLQTFAFSRDEFLALKTLQLADSTNELVYTDVSETEFPSVSIGYEVNGLNFYVWDYIYQPTRFYTIKDHSFTGQASFHEMSKGLLYTQELFQTPTLDVQELVSQAITMDFSKAFETEGTQLFIGKNNSSYDIPQDVAGEYILTPGSYSMYYSKNGSYWQMDQEFSENGIWVLPPYPSALEVGQVQLYPTNDSKIDINFTSTFALDGYKFNPQNVEWTYEVLSGDKSIYSTVQSSEYYKEFHNLTFDMKGQPSGEYQVKVTAKGDGFEVSGSTSFMHTSSIQDLKGTIFTFEKAPQELLTSGVAYLYRLDSEMNRYDNVLPAGFKVSAEGEVFIPDAYILDKQPYFIEMMDPSSKVAYQYFFTGQVDDEINLTAEGLKTYKVEAVAGENVHANYAFVENGTNAALQSMIPQTDFNEWKISTPADVFSFVDYTKDQGNTAVLFSGQIQPNVPLNVEEAEWKEFYVATGNVNRWMTFSRIQSGKQFSKVQYAFANKYQEIEFTLHEKDEVGTYSQTQPLFTEGEVSWQPVSMYSTYIADTHSVALSYRTELGKPFTFNGDANAVFEIANEQGDLLYTTEPQANINTISLPESLKNDQEALVIRLLASDIPASFFASQETVLYPESNSGELKPLTSLLGTVDDRFSENDFYMYGTLYQKNDGYDGYVASFSKETGIQSITLDRNTKIDPKQQYVIKLTVSFMSSNKKVLNEIELTGEELLLAQKEGLSLTQGTFPLEIKPPVESDVTSSLNGHIKWEGSSDHFYVNGTKSAEMYLPEGDVQIMVNRRTDNELFVDYHEVQLTDNGKQVQLTNDNKSSFVVKNNDKPVSLLGISLFENMSTMSILREAKASAQIEKGTYKNPLISIAVKENLDTHWGYIVTKPELDMSTSQIWNMDDKEMLVQALEADVYTYSTGRQLISADLKLESNGIGIEGAYTYTQSQYNGFGLNSTPVRPYEGLFDESNHVPLSYVIKSAQGKEIEKGTFSAYSLRHVSLDLKNNLPNGQYTLELIIPTAPRQSVTATTTFTVGQVEDEDFVLLQIPENNVVTKEATIAVSGSTKKNSEVTVTLESGETVKETKTVIADAEGKFSTSLSPTEDGTYTVKAVQGEAESTRTITIDRTAPAKATDITFAPSASGLDVSWTAAEDAKTFDVEVAVDNGTFTKVASEQSTKTFTIKDIEANKTYKVRITSYDEVGNSTVSEVADYTVEDFLITEFTIEDLRNQYGMLPFGEKMLVTFKGSYKEGYEAFVDFITSEGKGSVVATYDISKGIYSAEILLGFANILSVEALIKDGDRSAEKIEFIDWNVGAKVTGKVTDGEAVAGTTVRITSDRYTMTTKTNEAGEFEFNGLPKGTYTPSILFEGKTYTFAAFETDLGEVIELEKAFELPSVVQPNVQFKTTEGELITDELSVRISNPETNYTVYGYINTKGEFVTHSGKALPKLATGTYDVFVYGSGLYLDTEAEVELKKGTSTYTVTVSTLDFKETTLTITLPEGMDSVDYVSLWNNEVEEKSGYALGGYYFSDATQNDLTDLKIIAAKGYELYIYKEGFKPFRVSNADYSQGPITVEAELDAGREISGTVSHDGKAVAGTQVYASGQNSYANAVTDANGNFTLQGLDKDEEIHLTIYSDGVFVQYDHTFAASEENVTGHNVELAKAVNVSGKVQDKDGNGMEYVNIDVRKKDGSYAGWTRTAQDGSFLVTGLVSGQDYTFTYAKYGYPSITETVSSLTDERVVVMQHEAKGSLSGEGNSLSVNKSVVAPGEEVTYTLNYKNNETSEVTNIPVDVKLDSNLELMAASALLNGKPVSVTGTTISIPSVQPDATGTISFKAKVKDSAETPTLTTTVDVTNGEDVASYNASTNLVFVNLNVPAQTGTKKVKVYGTAKKGAIVEIYQGQKLLTSTKVESKYYYADVTLDIPADAEEADVTLTAKVLDGTKVAYSKPATVAYKANIPAMKDVSVYAGWNGTVKLNPYTGLATFAITEHTPMDTTITFEDGADVEDMKLHFLGKDYAMTANGSTFTFEGTELGKWTSYGEQLLEVSYKTKDGLTVRVPLMNIIVLIDPSGYVFEGSMDNRLSGVQAVVETRANESSPWVKWDAQKFGQINPQITDDEGRYGWDVITGQWRVVFTKDGYIPYVSRVMDVPPVETELNIPMVKAADPALKTTEIKSNNLTVEFDRPMVVNPANFELFKVEGEKRTKVDITVTANNARNGYKSLTEKPEGKSSVFNDSNDEVGFFEADSSYKVASSFTIVPTATLTAGASYELVVKATAKDAEGRSVGLDTSFSFETDAAPVVVPPVVSPPVVTPPAGELVVIENGKAVVNKDKLMELFASSEARIGLDLSKVVGTTLPTIAFDSEALSKMKANQSVVIQLPKQIVELPASVLTELAKQGTQVELSVQSENVANASSDQVTFKMVTMKDGKATTQSKFAAPITVSMQLKNAPTDPRKVAVFYINGDAKTYMGGDVKDGMVTFSTNHFSSFVALEGNKTFTDLPAYAKEAVEVLASRGIINGKTDTRYGSGDSITRAEFAVLVARSLALPIESYKGTFTDVPASMKWAAQHIEAANQAGIINGYNETTFKPGEKINRQEMAAMIMRALKYQNPDITVDESKFVNFLDSSDISSFAKKDVAMASAMGIINGFKSGNGYEFRPKQTATRGEAAKMLFEMLY